MQELTELSVSGSASGCTHCHLIGRYRGPAHSNNNLNYKDSFYIFL